MAGSQFERMKFITAEKQGEEIWWRISSGLMEEVWRTDGGGVVKKAWWRRRGGRL